MHDTGTCTCCGTSHQMHHGSFDFTHLKNCTSSQIPTVPLAEFPTSRAAFVDWRHKGMTWAMGQKSRSMMGFLEIYWKKCRRPPMLPGLSASWVTTACAIMQVAASSHVSPSYCCHLLPRQQVGLNSHFCASSIETQSQVPHTRPTV